MRKNKLILIGLIVLYVISIFLICIFKFQNNFYNAADLTIFFQAFDSLNQGDFLMVPVQGAQYWADHFSLLFFVFYPVFFIFKHPVLLLFLQTLFIGLAGWPLYLIAEKYLPAKKSLITVAVFLFNPLTISMNLFEFHFLPFVFFFFFFLFYFYLRKKWIWFYVFLILCLSVREDASLLILGFSIFILVEKLKSKKIKKAILSHEFLSSFSLSLVWFFAGLLIIKFFNDEPNKFFIYFDWLKNFKSAFFHFFSFSQLELLLQVFLPFVFIPLFKPKYLLISVFYYLEITAAYGAPLAHLHYGAPIMVGLILAMIFVLADWQAEQSRNFHLNIFQKISVPVLIIMIFYLNYFWGPWTDLDYKNESLDLENHLIEKIEKDKNVLSPVKFFPKLAKKNQVYSLGRAFWGHQQFSEKKYQIPKMDYVIIDQNELLTNELQKNSRRFYKKNYSAGKENLKKIIVQNNLILLENKGKYLFFGQEKKENPPTDDHNYQKIKLNESAHAELPAVLIEYYKDEKKIKSLFFKLFTNELNAPIFNSNQISYGFVDVSGYLGLNNLNYAVNKIVDYEYLSEKKFIDL